MTQWSTDDGFVPSRSSTSAARERQAIEIATSISGDRVVRVLDRFAGAHRDPQWIVCDNGPEFLSFALAVCVQDRGLEFDCIEPGKPVQDRFVESLNGTAPRRALER